MNPANNINHTMITVELAMHTPIAHTLIYHTQQGLLQDWRCYEASVTSSGWRSMTQGVVPVLRYKKVKDNDT